MPPLIQKWNELKDEDKDLFPLLEVSDCEKRAGESMLGDMVVYQGLPTSTAADA